MLQKCLVRGESRIIEAEKSVPRVSDTDYRYNSGPWTSKDSLPAFHSSAVPLRYARLIPPEFNGAVLVACRYLPEAVNIERRHGTDCAEKQWMSCECAVSNVALSFDRQSEVTCLYGLLSLLCAFFGSQGRALIRR